MVVPTKDSEVPADALDEIEKIFASRASLAIVAAWLAAVGARERLGLLFGLHR